jgi:hypothetical protein
LHEDTVLGGDSVGAGIVDVEEVACASCVSYGELIGRRTITVGLTGFTIKIKMRSSVACRSRPNLSGDSGFAALAAAFGVGFVGKSLVPVAGILAAVAGVVGCDVMAMRPAII